MKETILEEIFAKVFVAILKMDSEWLWKFYNLFRQMVEEGKTNRFVIRMDQLLGVAITSTDEFLETKIKKDVDSAIDAYLSTQDDVIIASPVYSEEPSDGSQAQNALGGEMRSTYLFYKDNGNEDL